MLIFCSSAIEQTDRKPDSVIQGSGNGILPVLSMIMREGKGIDGRPIQNATVGLEMTMDVYLDEPSRLFWEFLAY